MNLSEGKVEIFKLWKQATDHAQSPHSGKVLHFIQVTQRRFTSIYPQSERRIGCLILMEMKRETWGFSRDASRNISWGRKLLVRLSSLANVFESNFPPIPKDKAEEVAQLAIDP